MSLAGGERYRERQRERERERERERLCVSESGRWERVRDSGRVHIVLVPSLFAFNKYICKGAEYGVWIWDRVRDRVRSRVRGRVRGMKGVEARGHSFHS